MTDRRPRALRAAPAVAAVGLLAAVTAPLSPALADPDAPSKQKISEVRDRADHLYHLAEQASERVNDARIELEHRQGRLHELRHELRKQRRHVDRLHEMVVSSVVDQAQGQTISTTVQVLAAPDTDEFLGQMAAVSSFQDQQADLMAKYVRVRKAVADRRTRVADQVEHLADVRARLAEDRAEIKDRAAKAKELLGQLIQKRREAQSETTSTGVSVSSAPVSGAAGVAVSYALDQVGDAYVYGAAGPDAYDCSGLTMAAWAAAGVSLPHSSSAQMSSGTPVSSSALQPGDLVFYYSPVSHVGMYIGNGQVVHAANPSSGVEVSDVFSMPFSGAVRPG